MLVTDMSKTKMLATSPQGEPSYAHLLPIVEYAIEQGCRFETGWPDRPFHATRNGFECDMLGTLTMEDIAVHFELPVTIKIGGPHDRCIWDRENNIKLCIYRE